MKKILNFRTVLLLFFGTFYLVTFNSCDLFEDDMPDPIDQSELGDTLWTHARIDGDYFMNNSLARGVDGSIYYAVGGGTVFWTPSKIVAVNEDDGSLLWQTEDLDHMDLSSRIVVGDDGTVYAIGFYTLYAIDPNTGSFKWTWEVPETIPNPSGGDYFTKGQIGQLSLMDNGSLVLGSVGSGVYSRGLYGISKEGNTLWHNLDAVAWGVSSDITVGPNNSLYYYEDYYLKCVDGSSGNILWTTKLASTRSSANNIIVNGNGELICSFMAEEASEFYLHRIDPANGNILWSSTDVSSGYGQLLSPNGYVTQLIGDLHLFDMTNGVARKFTEEYLGLATAITNNNQYLIPRRHNSVFGCSTYDEDGTFDWHVNLANMKGQIVLDNNKVMYSIDNTGKIIAIQSDATLASSGWPKIGHDNRNTSNWSKN